MGINSTKISDDSAPSYRRAKRWLLGYIAEQKLGPGDKMPSERALADALGLSRPTVSRALGKLVEDGVLAREQRIGTYVGDYMPHKPAGRVGTVAIIMPWLSQDQTGSVSGYMDADRLGAPFRLESIHIA